MVLKLTRPNVTVFAICSGDHVASNLSSMILIKSSVHFPFGTELLRRVSYCRLCRLAHITVTGCVREKFAINAGTMAMKLLSNMSM